MIFNVAIIGCGRIAGHHCKSITNTSSMRLISVCDLEKEKAKNYGDKYNVPYYQNYHEMFEKHKEIDIVAIITPSGMHFEHSKEIITKYKKHLIVEKPTFLKISHLDIIYKLAKENNLNIYPVFQNRYNKAVQRVKQSLEKSETGNVRTASVRVRWCRTDSYYSLAPWRGKYSMDGGALTNQGIHHIDLLRYLFGEVDSVSARVRTLGSNIEAEDTIVAQFEFKSNAVGTLEITTAARPDNYEASLSAVCENGLIQLGGIAVNELQIFTPDPNSCFTHSEDFSGNVYGAGHFQFYKDIAANLENNIPFPISYEDNRNSIKLLHALYVSAENNGKVISVDDSLESNILGIENNELADIYRTNKLFCEI